MNDVQNYLNSEWKWGVQNKNKILNKENIFKRNEEIKSRTCLTIETYFSLSEKVEDKLKDETAFSTAQFRTTVIRLLTD